MVLIKKGERGLAKEMQQSTDSWHRHWVVHWKGDTTMVEREGDFCCLILAVEFINNKIERKRGTLALGGRRLAGKHNNQIIVGVCSWGAL